MSSTPKNLLHVMRRGEIAAWIVAAPVAMASVWWTLRPSSMFVTPTGAPVAPSRGTDKPDPKDNNKAESDAIASNTFAINLWNPPAPPPATNETAVAEAPAPKPLNLQLIGIISEGVGDSALGEGTGAGAGGAGSAAIYDVDEDRLLIVADGERIRNRTVHILPGGLVEITDGTHTQRLLLRPDKEASS